MIYPVKGYKINIPYGKKGTWQCGYHCGVDLIPYTAPKDYNIYAPCDAVVVNVVVNHKSYGNYIVLKHPDGYTSRYAHLANVCVKCGQAVKQGDKIGYMGTTGNSTGVHLHWEINYGDMSYPANTDPEKYMEENNMQELTKINDIAYEMRIRGIADDTDGLIKAVEKEPNGRLYWVCRRAIKYIQSKNV